MVREVLSEAKWGEVQISGVKEWELRQGGMWSVYNSSEVQVSVKSVNLSTV
jgi:hypothetical protein